MIEYIYFVKCDGCDDEHFYFFDEAKKCAMSCLNQKPIITQVEVDRNDFGECVDSCDLGTVWSWEDVMSTDKKDCADCSSRLTKDLLDKNSIDSEFDALDNSVEPEIDRVSVLDEIPDNFKMPLEEATEAEMQEILKLAKEIGIETISGLDRFDKEEADRGDNLLARLRAYRDELGPDFKLKEATEMTRDELIAKEGTDDVDLINAGRPEEDRVVLKAIPEGMTVEQLVEEMEENEDMVECTWCNDLFPKDECRYEIDLGYLCHSCEAAIKSRGEDLTFRENSYWDFLDEDIDEISEDEFFNQDFDVVYDEDADYEGAMAIEAEENEAESEIDEISTPEEAVNFLVKDEEEAVAGYEKAAEVIEDSDIENKDEILEVIDHIREEEEEHIEELAELALPTEEDDSEDEIDEVSDDEEIEIVEDSEDEVLVEEGLSEHIQDHSAPIESDQELKGIDNAVVDCKVADVITHSEDEKPVDCKGEKKPLEKPLTEAVMIDCPECGAVKAFDRESEVCNSCGFIL